MEAAHRVPYEIIFEPDAIEHLQGFSSRTQSMMLDQIEVQLTYQPDAENTGIGSDYVLIR